MHSHSMVRTIPSSHEDSIPVGCCAHSVCYTSRGVTVSGPGGMCPLLKEPADDPSPSPPHAGRSPASPGSLIHLDLPSFHSSLLSSIACRDCPPLHSTCPTIRHILLSHQWGPQPSLGLDPTSGYRGMEITHPGREKISMWMTTVQCPQLCLHPHPRAERGLMDKPPPALTPDMEVQLRVDIATKPEIPPAPLQGGEPGGVPTRSPCHLRAQAYSSRVDHP